MSLRWHAPGRGGVATTLTPTMETTPFRAWSLAGQRGAKAARAELAGSGKLAQGQGRCLATTTTTEACLLVLLGRTLAFCFVSCDPYSPC